MIKHTHGSLKCGPKHLKGRYFWAIVTFFEYLALLFIEGYIIISNGLFVLGRILEKEGGCMTEDIRQKYKYLKHLPVTCQVEFAEICLNEPDVNADTLELYKSIIINAWKWVKLLHVIACRANRL